MLLIIDVESRFLKALISKLKRLKTTVAIQSGGAYHQDKSYSQVWFNSSWTLPQLEDWLYNYAHPVEYVGAVEMPVCKVCGGQHCLFCNP